MTTESTGKARLLSAGALLSAVAASVCCIGPVALALLGLGGGALLLKFEPYRAYLLAATALFLGAAFYLTYRRAAVQDCAGSACRPAASRKSQKAALWIVTLIVVLAATFPYYSNRLF